MAKWIWGLAWIVAIGPGVWAQDAPPTPGPSSSSVPPPADVKSPDTKAEAGRVVVAPAATNSRDAAGLLRPPGSDGYDAPIDWRNVPAWKQTSFFGVRSVGKVFVFVVDCSGSMADDARLVRAKAELRRCIQAMQYPQRYFVIFYNDRPLPMPGDVPRGSDQRGKLQSFRWLSSIDAEGETDPRGALRMALALKPDAVFLLSDGEFPEGTAEEVKQRNRAKVPVHCIDLAAAASAGGQLRTIAKESGGQYAARP
jgi:hypothetical protein